MDTPYKNIYRVAFKSCPMVSAIPISHYIFLTTILLLSLPNHNVYKETIKFLSDILSTLAFTPDAT